VVCALHFADEPRAEEECGAGWRLRIALLRSSVTLNVVRLFLDVLRSAIDDHFCQHRGKI